MKRDQNKPHRTGKTVSYAGQAVAIATACLFLSIPACAEETPSMTLRQGAVTATPSAAPAATISPAAVSTSAAVGSSADTLGSSSAVAGSPSATPAAALPIDSDTNAAIPIGSNTNTAAIPIGSNTNAAIPIGSDSNAALPIDADSHTDEEPVEVSVIESDMSGSPPVILTDVTPELIRSVQTALTQAGFPCKVDGIKGKETTGCIQSYQQAHHLYVNGEITVELLEEMGLRKKPYQPVPQKSKRESWQTAQFNPNLYAGKWYRLSNQDGTAYRIYFPENWKITRSRPTPDTLELYYEDPSEQPHDFDMVCIRLIRSGPAADEVMTALRETSLFYDGYHNPNTTAADCRVSDFSGMILTATEEEGQPLSLTRTFTGQNPEGQVLVAGFSTVTRRPKVRKTLENILCSVQPVNPDASSTAIHAPAYGSSR